MARDRRPHSCPVRTDESKSFPGALGLDQASIDLSNSEASGARACAMEIPQRAFCPLLRWEPIGATADRGCGQSAWRVIGDSGSGRSLKEVGKKGREGSLKVKGRKPFDTERRWGPGVAKAGSQSGKSRGRVVPGQAEVRADVRAVTKNY
jgi:hypothetical protein